jgi:hypothetical protein
VCVYDTEKVNFGHASQAILCLLASLAGQKWQKFSASSSFFFFNFIKTTKVKELIKTLKINS